MRKYIDPSHYRTPFKSPNLTLTGLGTPDELLKAWPKGRAYFDVSRFRNPYRDGFFQDNSLFGLGKDEPLVGPELEALVKHGPSFYPAFVQGTGPAPQGIAAASANLEATSAQIPQWVWLVAAAGTGYLAYRSYKATRKAR